jgi:putative ABC transport system ATP-binding protein
LPADASSGSSGRSLRPRPGKKIGGLAKRSGFDALRGVSLEIEEGSLTAIMGPSGSGKSTLMHILAGLDKPTEGSVWIAGLEISSMNDRELTRLRREHIRFVFQFFNLLPMLTAEENVLLPLSIAGVKPDREWVQELLDSVGIAGRRTHRPSEMSGGQQQRVSIARALVSSPTVLFADEPTGNLDSTTSREVLALLRHSVQELGQTTVMVTHDPKAAAFADRILFIADGRIVKEIRESTGASLRRHRRPSGLGQRDPQPRPDRHRRRADDRARVRRVRRHPRRRRSRLAHRRPAQAGHGGLRARAQLGRLEVLLAASGKWASGVNGVTVVSSIRADRARALGSTTGVGAVVPATIAQVFHFT